MIPKAGEPILIGRQIKSEKHAMPSFGEDDSQIMVVGGDRSYIDHVWVCVSVEDDRCVVFNLLPKDKKPSWLDFGVDRPRMILFDEYPINKCSETTLEYSTGYKLSDNLIKAVTKQMQNVEKINFD